MKNLNVAVVGSNRGIGLELTKQLSQYGNTVYAFCRKSSSELNDLKNIKINVKIIDQFEVTDLRAMSLAIQTAGLKNIDILIHVSGILREDDLNDINEDGILEQFKVNALAPILSVKAFLPLMSEGSKVGLITSRMGSVADNTSGGMYGYRMSKSALNMAGKSLSEDLKDQDITVLLLHPGYVKTDMTGHQGHITPKESAAGLIKILDEKTIDQTGTFWHVNGEALPW